MICSNRRIEKDEKNGEKEEIEETPVVEIHLNCPAYTGSRESPLELRQDPAAAAAVSSSVEVLDIESDEQSLSDTSSFLSDDECDVASPQDLEDDFSLEVRGKSCLPRNVQITGLGRQDDFHSRGLASVESPACSSSRNERQLQQGTSGYGKSRKLAKVCPGPSVHQSTRNISLPPPRPSEWQQVYSKVLKEREQLADEKLKKRSQPRAEKTSANLEEAGIRARSIRLIKKIKQSMRLKAAQDPNNGPAALPTDEAIARMFGVDVEDCRDSSSNSSSSGSRASSKLSSTVSRYSLTASNKDLKEEPLESANNRQKSGRKSRRWFRFKTNKVTPL